MEGESRGILLFIFPIGCVCCWLLVSMSSQILVQVLTRGFGFSIPTFVVFMPIWMSWLWLDRIMMFWFVLSLKSKFKVFGLSRVSQSSISLALVASKKGCGTVVLGPRVWLFMLGKESLLLAEQVGVLLP